MDVATGPSGPSYSWPSHGLLVSLDVLPQPAIGETMEQWMNQLCSVSYEYPLNIHSPNGIRRICRNIESKIEYAIHWIQQIVSYINIQFAVICVLWIPTPSGNFTWRWNITCLNRKTHYEWPVAIPTSMSNYQRVYPDPMDSYESSS